jgi:uncharacterized membrane protein YbhN (UPF0104 family)
LTDLDSAEIVAPATSEKAKRGARWRGAITLLGLVGLTIAAVSSTRSAQEHALPGPGPMAIAFVLHIVALAFAAQAWISLFPPSADRRELARGLYTSQLTKYLPAGGVAQAASQVAFAGNQEGGLRAAALRLPVFSMCAVVSGATIGSTLVFDSDLPTWGRALAACALLSLLALRRSVLAAVLRLARRVVKRLPEPDALPPQGAILRCYACCLGNLLAFSIGFAVLLGDLSNVGRPTVVAAMAAAWTAGYLVVPLPGGLGVREAVIVAALPGVSTGTLLAVSVAHRLLGLTAEGSLAGIAHVRALRDRRAARLPDTRAATH